MKKKEWACAIVGVYFILVLLDKFFKDPFVAFEPKGPCIEGTGGSFKLFSCISRSSIH